MSYEDKGIYIRNICKLLSKKIKLKCLYIEWFKLYGILEKEKLWS